MTYHRMASGVHSFRLPGAPLCDCHRYRSPSLSQMLRLTWQSVVPR